MSRQFRTGDRVRCISSNSEPSITNGDIYTVTSFSNVYNRISFFNNNGNEDSCGCVNFELAAPREMSRETLLKRANLGLNSLKQLMKDDISTLWVHFDKKDTMPLAAYMDDLGQILNDFSKLKER